MVRIKKSWEPTELINFKKNGAVRYEDLDSGEGSLVKEKIKKSLCSEQFGLCAYCMGRITLETMKIEHFIPRADKIVGEIKSLDYSNMLGVCDGGVGFNKAHNLVGKENLSCDAYKRNNLLSLNPSIGDDFDKMKIRYSSDGKIHSDSLNLNFQNEINNVLNLNVPRLINMRKAVKREVIEFLKRKGKLTQEQKFEKIRSIKTPKDGLLQPFFDVAVYFIDKLA